MQFLTSFKSTVFIWFLILIACGGKSIKKNSTDSEKIIVEAEKERPKIVVAANRTEAYLPLLKGKKIAVVANQTSVIFKEDGHTHLIDSLLAHDLSITKVFAPEHGFRGRVDAGEKFEDGIDSKTGLPLISLYGKNRKPSAEQLRNVECVVFDIQDVGVRFYTYIATLQLVMEACADAHIPVIVLDRPNPNGHYVDGPTMKAEHTGFLGMTEIPLVYGMTIGEYAKMINEEELLKSEQKAELTIIRLENYTHQSFYNLPIRPSPNLPNAKAISLYPSLGLFEGTNVNAGRGTEFQFQRYGASFLDSTAYDLAYTPQSNFGSKYPKEKGKVCFGNDLSDVAQMNEVSMQWIIDAYHHATDQSKFFITDGFTKHAGTTVLQKQIETGMSAKEIRTSWQVEIEAFKKRRAKYLLYP